MSYYAIITSNSFYHHGIKGQIHGLRRAEWYPIDKYREHLKNLGYDEKTINKKMKKAEKGEIKYKKYVAKTKAKNLAKAQAIRKSNLDAKKEVAEKAKSKEELIKNGDIREINKNAKDYTNEEIDTAMKRYQAIKSLSNEVNKSFAPQESKTKQFIKEVGSESIKTIAKNTSISVGYMVAKAAVDQIMKSAGKQSIYDKHMEWKKLNK